MVCSASADHPSSPHGLQQRRSRLCCGVLRLTLPALAASLLPPSTPLRVRIHGAGPTGALAALAMADAGWSVSLHDPLDVTALCARERAYALTQSSRRLLQRLRLWNEIEPGLSPFRLLHLCDLGAGAGLDFTPADLPDAASRAVGGPLGWIARHRSLMETLLIHLRRHPAIALHLGDAPQAGAGAASAPPDTAEPDLILAADGPASPTREALGIGRWRLPYRQSCLTVQVELRGAEGGQAWELLRPEGPFAVLPLAERQAQLVWSAPEARCRQRQALDDTALLELLAGVLPPGLEPDGLLDAPRSFPVALELARRLYRGRTLLVGESAHRCHPVGGQGLNLCWRDVADLHRLALRVQRGRLPLRRLGPLYARRRWPDLLLTLAATDLMVRLFSNRSPLLLPLRALALALLARARGLRRLSLRLMSEGSGRLAASSPE